MEKNVVLKLFLKFTLLITILSSVFSCAVSPGPMKLLDNTVRSYDRAIRWGEFARAKSFHKDAPTLTDLERRRLKLYRVTDYTVLQNDAPDEYNAYLVVEIKYYKNDRPVIKSVVAKQHWKREKESKIWYLNSAFPKFR